MSGWSFAGQPSAGGSGTVTLVAGSTFCIGTTAGNVIEGAPMGLFVRDTRVLSRWVLEVDGDRLEPLTVRQHDPFRATFVTRARPRPGRADSTLLVVRHREVGDGMLEEIRVRNLGHEAAGVTLTLEVHADFADLFEVKEGRVHARTGVLSEVDDELLHIHHEEAGHTRGLLVRAAGAPTRSPGLVTWHLVVPAREEWTALVRLEATAGETVAAPRHTARTNDGASSSAERMRAWRGAAPVLSTPHAGLTRTLARSLEDLGALRMFDPDHPQRSIVAAGAPWFMAVFGRDSLLTSWMVLPLDQQLALGTLQTLASFQGRSVEPLSEEQPGRIPHELRFGRRASLALGGGNVYYGTVDATPLFVMLLGELRRWGIAPEQVDALLPAADRALEWLLTYGDRDADGFVEYQRATDRGLLHQGWKDSVDGVTFADGRLAEPPIALCEAQAYAYGAYLARAHFAREVGDAGTAEDWARRANDLKTAFNERFWLPDRGWFALALDRDKRPVDALTSNIGHCLWSGIVDQDKAASVAEHLLSPRMFTGFGVRTLASDMAAYNPLSYHNGSVWPHDNAILAAGLARYGFVDEAREVALGILAAAERFDGRLPELFCGFDRDEFPDPVPFPTSCSPQAWASAAPVQLLRTLLRFDPWVPFGQVWLAPVLPEQFLPMRLDQVALAGARVDLEVGPGNAVSVTGLPDSVALVEQPRPPLSSLVDEAASPLRPADSTHE
jgi:glycogen debranching enzyme